MRIFWLFLFSLYVSNVIADNAPNLSCPDVHLCIASEGPKRNLAFVKSNQQAYDCYRSNGDITMAKNAGIALTRCQTMFAASTATVKDQ